MWQCFESNSISTISRVHVRPLITTHSSLSFSFAALWPASWLTGGCRRSACGIKVGGHLVVVHGWLWRLRAAVHACQLCRLLQQCMHGHGCSNKLCHLWTSHQVPPSSRLQTHAIKANASNDMSEFCESTYSYHLLWDHLKSCVLRPLPCLSDQMHSELSPWHCATSWRLLQVLELARGCWLLYLACLAVVHDRLCRKLTPRPQGHRSSC